MTELSFLKISFLTFQAVVQVILVCFAGFWAAKTGLLNKTAQKNVSILNVDIFTPALVFSKLAPSLSLKKLIEIIVIPIFYAVSTGISYIVSLFVSKYLNLDNDETNFVTAMSVFGNSNSLPVSLTVALAYTLPNLEWDDVENDDPSQVASRGILYLLIFQQIGQVLRWSWGYNTLLKKRVNPNLLTTGYTLDVERDLNPSKFETVTSNNTSTSTLSSSVLNNVNTHANEDDDDDEDHDVISAPSSSASNEGLLGGAPSTRFSSPSYTSPSSPSSSSSTFNKFTFKLTSAFKKVTNFMNPPLYAMAAAVFVASVPILQNSFYKDNGFVQNTVAEAINQLGTVSIPLILIVLGSNLYPSNEMPPATPHYNRIVFGSLISRMIIPPLILLPLIALAVKLFPVSIIDDPIFLVVTFILTISPPAIQLSQICQLNELFEKEMAGVLFWGYVVLTLPTTIIIVSTALETLKWAIHSKA